MLIAKHFETYLSEFANLHGLFDRNRKYLVAVSGGLDSVVLLHMLGKLAAIKFEVIHFNHGTRPENEAEENFVAELCLQWNVELHIKRFNLNLQQHNFENVAREARKKSYHQFIKKGYMIVEAHHIDDSFEWSLIQKFQQGSFNQTLGIPLKSKSIIRPFMAFTKQQLKTYAKLENIYWMEDQSNLDRHHLRNYLRLEIIPKIKRRFPNYLKNYSLQQNQLAYHLNCHAKKASNCLSIAHSIHGKVFQGDNLESARSEIIESIIELSSLDRGKINKVLDQVFKAIQTRKDNPKIPQIFGPLSIAGTVKIFGTTKRIWITNDHGLNLIARYDQAMVDLIREKSHIPFGFINSNLPEHFPNLYIGKGKNFKQSKLIGPIFEQTMEELKKSDIPYGLVYQ